MVYSPHTAQSTHKYDAKSGSDDYAHLDAEEQKSMYDATKDYMQNNSESKMKDVYQNDKGSAGKKDEEAKGLDLSIENEEHKSKVVKKEDDSFSIPKLAASEINQEIKDNKKDYRNKKNVSSIEEAIKKAIKSEKETFHR